MEMHRLLRRFLRRLGLGLVISLGCWLLLAGSAWAAIQFEETPSGKLVFESVQTVQDSTGTTWQITLFQIPQGPAVSPVLGLGLANLTTDVSVDPTVPVTLMMGERSSQVLLPRGARSPLDDPMASFDGQYTLNTLRDKGSEESVSVPKALVLTLTNGEKVTLPISADCAQEWRTVVSCKALLC